jgi:hypothetical protein
MYTAEISFQSPVTGQPKVKKYPTFEARNDNHAIRRIIKTAIQSGLALHMRINLWAGETGVAHIYINKVLGSGKIIVNDVEYGPQNWYESFPG